MILGLLTKTWLETRFTICLCVTGMMIVAAGLTAILPQLQSTFNEVVAQMPFVQTMASGMMGIDVSGGLSAKMMLALTWTHPVVLAIVWGCEIALCTRLPAGEIDRATIETLLGWPVSRLKVWLTETLVWIGAGVGLVVGGLVGYAFAAQWIEPANRPELVSILLVQVNLLTLYLAVGGFGFFISSLSNRRTIAIAVVAGVLIASFLLNFLSQFWPPAERVVFLSVSHYYQPAQVLLRATLVISDVVVLSAVGLISWIAGLTIWLRRDVGVV